MDPNLARHRAARAVGVAAPAVFVASFLVQGVRPEYEPLSQFVSELAIGPYGWVQTVTFVVTGLGYVCFGLLLRRGEGASRFGAASLVLVGFGLFASAFFVTDPSAMFDQKSSHGIIHGLLGAVVFAFFPVTCFVFVRRLRLTGHHLAARLSVLTAIMLIVGIMLLKYSELPDSWLFEWKGLVQRAILVLFMGWTAAIAIIQTRTKSAVTSGEHDVVEFRFRSTSRTK
jgi:hypothetical protein